MWRRAKRIEGSGLNKKAGPRPVAQDAPVRRVERRRPGRLFRSILLQATFVALANAALLILALGFEPGLLAALPYFAIFSFVLIAVLVGMAISSARSADDSEIDPSDGDMAHMGEIMAAIRRAVDQTGDSPPAGGIFTVSRTDSSDGRLTVRPDATVDEILAGIESLIGPQDPVLMASMREQLQASVDRGDENRLIVATTRSSPKLAITRT